VPERPIGNAALHTLPLDSEGDLLGRVLN